MLDGTLNDDELRRRRRKEVKRAITKLRVPLPGQTRAVREILDLIDEELEPAGQRSTLGNLLMLIGEPGVGKSTCIDMVVAMTDCRILVVPVPESATPSTLMEAMLKALCERFVQEGVANDKASRVKEALTEQSFTLLIFDEIQHFLDKSKNKRVNHRAAQYLKSFLDEIKLPAVLVGPREALKAFSDKHEGELASRVRAFIPLRPFDQAHGGSDLQDYAALLVALEQAIDFPDPSDLTGTEKSSFILGKTSGRIRHICKLVLRAAHLAIDEGLRCITIDVLTRAAEEVFNSFNDSQEPRCR